MPTTIVHFVIFGITTINHPITVHFATFVELHKEKKNSIVWLVEFVERPQKLRILVHMGV
jgi:hypothetical protein